MPPIASGGCGWSRRHEAPLRSKPVAAVAANAGGGIPQLGSCARVRSGPRDRSGSLGVRGCGRVYHYVEGCRFSTTRPFARSTAESDLDKARQLSDRQRGGPAAFQPRKAAGVRGGSVCVVHRVGIAPTSILKAAGFGGGG